jgi:hypothetical protein
MAAAVAIMNGVLASGLCEGSWMDRILIILTTL